MIGLIRRISDHTWKKIHWPDCECLWYFPAFRKARSLAAKWKYDAVISVSTPFTSHLIGLRVHSLLPSARWLADNGDPFSFHTVESQNNCKLYHKLNFSIEKKVFSSADQVTVTSQGTLDKYCFFFPECAGKMTVIPPLVSFSRDGFDKKPFFEKNGKIKLLYVGNYYRPVRKPAFLLRVFRMLMTTHLRDRLELHFVGRVRDVMDYFVPYRDLLDSKKIVLHGMVDHRKALNAMSDADILVNSGNETSYQVPSKLPDYLAAGKPIINFATINDDSTALFFKNYPLFLNIPDNDLTAESHDFRRLVDFISDLPEALDDNTVETFIQPYTIETIAREYMFRITKPDEG